MKSIVAQSASDKVLGIERESLPDRDRFTEMSNGRASVMAL